MNHATTVSRSNQLSNRSLGLWTLVMAFTLGALSTVMTGCRFGNKVTKTGGEDPDSITGFYGTAPQALRFCASHAQSACAEVPTPRIPSLIGDIMSSPVALIVEDLEMGEAVFTAYNDGRKGMPVWIGSDDRALRYVNSYRPQPLWRDSTCTSRMYLEEEGAIVPGESVAVPGSSRNTLGRITLRVRVTEVFESNLDGACATTRQAMSACYQDISQCGGGNASENQALQDAVRAVFEPYIQAHAMTAADIPDVTTIAYEIEYR